MIHQMKKISILLYHRERDEFLKSLQQLGVVHIIENESVSSQEIDSLHEQLRKSTKVLRVSKNKTLPMNSNTLLADKPELMIKRFEELEQEREKTEQRIAALKKECSLIEPWGDFDPAIIQHLSDSGIFIRFFETSEKKFATFDTLNWYHAVIKKEGGKVLFFTAEYKDAAPPPIDAEEVLLPTIRLSKTLQDIKSLEQTAITLQESIKSFQHHRDLFLYYQADTKNELSYYTAQHSMECLLEGKILSLSGWIPIENEPAIAEFLSSYVAWYSISHPAPNDPVPVKLRNSSFAQLFEPITKIFSLPDYFEIDPTPFFAPLFALFFGLCLGDLGYGSIVLLLSIFLFLKSKPSFKPFCILGMVLGSFTMLIGILSNTFFGYPLFYQPEISAGFIKHGLQLAFFRSVESDKGTFFPLMAFSLYIGIFQIIVGLILKACNKARSFGFEFSLQPIGSILTLCGAFIFIVKSNFVSMQELHLGILPIGFFISSIQSNIAYSLCCIGILMILLFNNAHKKNVGVRLGLGIWELYTFVTGIMGNVLSYLRLFALGLAGGLLGAAYNQLAFMVITKDGQPNFASPMIIFAILILLFGHSLNLGLGLLGSFVHPLRLTFVEFYQNVEFKGGSKAYKPFKYEKQPI